MTTTTGLFRTLEGGQAVPAGEVIFSFGEAAENLYVIQEGKVEIRVGGQVVEIVGPGGLFGEMAMIDGSTRSADALASEDSVILPIDQRRFDFLISDTPFFARTVMNVLVHRLRAANSSCT